MGTRSDKPILWHIPISHYSEKARWALAWKDVEHRRRTPVPGAHIPVALWLTRGRHYTFPVLTIGGRHVGDSTAIIAALEESFPEPALYPEDPAERQRALALEDFFDEELGPPIRQLVWHELGNDPDRFGLVLERTTPPALTRVRAASIGYARAFTGIRFRARSREAAAESRAKVLAALDRLDRELAASGTGYLAGDSFSVADLTAASLFYPLAAPEGAPLPADQPMPEAFEQLREEVEGRPGIGWVREMFRLHRRPARRDAVTA